MKDKLNRQNTGAAYMYDYRSYFYSGIKLEKHPKFRTLLHKAEKVQQLFSNFLPFSFLPFSSITQVEETSQISLFSDLSF